MMGMEGKIPASEIVKGLSELLEKLSDFNPELISIDIDYATGETWLRFSVRVPDSTIDTIGNKIVLPRPKNFTFVGMMREGIFIENGKVTQENGEIQIPARDASGGDYTLDLKGSIQEEILSNIVETNTREKPPGRSKCRKRLTAGYPPISFQDKEVEIKIRNVDISMEFDDTYIPERVDDHTDRIIEMAGEPSDAWLSPYEESSVTERSVSRNSSNVTDSEIINEIKFMFDEKTLNDHLVVKIPFDHDNTNLPDGPLVPDQFQISTVVDLYDGRIHAEGEAVFEKADFWDRVSKSTNDLAEYSETH